MRNSLSEPGHRVPRSDVSESRHTFDVARDYTEKWHHTQQIFEATGKPSTIMSRRLYHPCLDTFMRALPCTFREVDAPQGSVVAVRVTGEAGGDWYVQRHSRGWEQLPEFPGEPAATVIIPQESAWKLVTKRRDRERVLAEFPEIQIDGDMPLGMHVLEMISVMA